MVIQEFLEKKGGTSLYNLNQSSLIDSDIQVGAVGLEIELTIMDGDVAVNISDATLMKIIIQKPGGSAVEKTARFVNDGTDGKLYYRTVTGDIDVSGVWRVQAHVVSPSFDMKSTIVSFRVNKNLA